MGGHSYASGATVNRMGLGCLKNLQVEHLWMQEAEVNGAENPSDLHLSSACLQRSNFRLWPSLVLTPRCRRSFLRGLFLYNFLPPNNLLHLPFRSSSDTSSFSLISRKVAIMRCFLLRSSVVPRVFADDDVHLKLCQKQSVITG